MYHIHQMSPILDALVNLWRLLRNARARLLGRTPDYVWIEVGGSLPEFETPVGFLRRRLSPGPAPVTLEGLRARLDRISADGRPRGVVLRLRDLGAGWAALEELRRELLAFREGGGRVVAYLVDGADTRSYYLACAADEILATPLATLNVIGVRARVNFFKDALDRLGLQAEVVAVSPYKSAGDPYVRNDFSRESREQLERLVNRRYEELNRAISEGRDLSFEEARAAIDRAPYGAREALAGRLLDGVCYEDELPQRLGSEGRGARLSEWDAARKALRMPYRRRLRRRVGLVNVSGAIVRGKSRRLPLPLPFVGAEQAGSESVVAALRVAERDRRVAAVLLRVESPGGDALASDLIWREVERLRAKKPVVVLMGNVAASGGYYVSAPASHVVARRNTVTGSIGVLMVRPVAGGLYGKLGINPASVTRGVRAGLLDPSRRPTPDELRVLERQLSFVYDEFKDRVSRGRKVGPQDLEGIAGGRVWTGEEALEIGLVDELGGFREALRKARELGGIEGEAPEVLVKISGPRAGRPAPGDPVEGALDLVGEMGRAISRLRADRVWALAPYEISED
ncbi:MAG: signal peptide peptidase SppA [Actinomycetota bacterium]|nr:signal peptide peptidase SppA [Actinomycetota bacterium]